MLVRSTLKKSGTTPSTGPPAADTVMPRETDSYGKWYGFQQGGNNVCGSSRHHQKQTALPPASTVQAAQLQHQGVSPLAPVHWLAQAAPRQPVCGESAAPTVGMSRVPSLQFALEVRSAARNGLASVYPPVDRLPMSA